MTVMIAIFNAVVIYFALRVYFLALIFLISRKDKRVKDGMISVVRKAILPTVKTILLLFIAATVTTIHTHSTLYASNYYIVFLFIALPASLGLLITIFNLEKNGQVLKKVRNILGIKSS